MTMSTTVWRLLDSGPMPGAANMALDEAILEAYLAGLVPPTLRFYAWRPPAVSLGHFQPPEGNVRAERCRQLGIDIVRRPTWGRAILHDREVTFSIIVSEADLGAQGVMACYRILAQGIVAGLRQLGVAAELVDRAGGREEGPALRLAGNPACFAVKARCDLVVAGKKLVGSAQVHRQGALLQQNSLPLRLNLSGWAEVFAGGAQGGEAATDLCSLLGREIRYAEVAAELSLGFASDLGWELQPGQVTAWEVNRSEQLRSANSCKLHGSAVSPTYKRAQFGHNIAVKEE